MAGQDSAQLYKEMAFLGYHLHWSPDTLMSLDHQERRRWCEQVSQINEELNAEGGKGGSRPVPLLP